MYLIKRTVGLLCVFVFATSGFAQNKAYMPQKMSVAALKADFQLLCDTLQKIHPGIYRYKSSASISHIFDSCYNAIQDSMTVPQFFLLTNFAIAAMEDGHSNSRGGYYGNTSGDEAFITLPNSQLSCRIPLVKYTSAVKQEANKGNSILPEYAIYPTINDFINHTDSQLESALEIVRKN